MRGKLAVVALFLLAAFSLLGEPPGQEIRDAAWASRFFRSGVSAKPIETQIEGSPQNFDAGLFPCAGCHGGSGEGRREGGTLTADIRFPQLRRRGYQKESFCQALRQGLDPAGQTLARAMPRYLLEPAECSALWEHLRHLEEDLPPGIDAKTIRIALPFGQETPTRLAWRAALEAELKRTSEAGGVYGRRFQLTEGKEPATIRILLDGQLPAEGEARDELLISVPPPSETNAEWQLWQVETPHERQLALIAQDAATWQLVRGKSPEAEKTEAQFRDAALDAEVQIQSSSETNCSEAARDVLVLQADEATINRLEKFDRCPGKRRFVLFEPKLPLETFASLKSPFYLVVPFDPGPEEDLNAGARLLGQTLIQTFDRAGRALRIPKLAEELDRSFAEKSGDPKSLSAGLLLLPGQPDEESRWLGQR